MIVAALQVEGCRGRIHDGLIKLRRERGPLIGVLGKRAVDGCDTLEKGSAELMWGCE